MTRQAGKETVHKLVEDFEKNEREYMSKNFQETEARNRFIDPFFTALGWELNQTGIAGKFLDVHREFSQRDNSVTKKPDYAFRVKEGAKYREKFFVEAKAPHVDLKGKNPVFQAKRYAFSSHGKTPIVVLTDFQTFRVFNGLEKPVFENPDHGLIHDLEYHAYPDKWDVIWDDFSKEAVTEGSIEQLIGKVGRNAKSLDDEFLADISAWRETLARNVALRNKDLSADHINEAVQRILDRLIFIRNLEDREIESENALLSIINEKENIYPHLLPLFRRLDGEYNGLLFKEHFSETITVDDPIIKGIVKQLYPPNSPYAFDMIEPEILGRIYERFLGSKIRLTENHQAKVEEKPEVRHAGGVYYTPQYIVDYIVENTVGVKIKDKTPEEIEAVKICDPACGSGSFLLGAFQHLIEYHREWYAKADPAAQKKYRDDFFTNAENEIQLTLKKKTEILKNNIFGVDIDREATEVAIMSLYLKILDEGYDKGQAELFLRGHILPDMTGNIKCGNSLIETDFYNQGNLDLTDNDLNKVNCFDWDGKDGFADIFKNGGFDVVIGNPPWVDIKGLPPNEVSYYFNHYHSAENRINLYALFYEKALSMLKTNGIQGFIIPSSILFQSSYSKLRENILCNFSIRNITKLPDNVFQNVTAESCIIIIENINASDEIRILVFDASVKLEKIDNKMASIEKVSSSKEWKNLALFCFDIYSNTEIIQLLSKIETKKNYLEKYCDFSLGITPYDKYRGHTQKQITEKVFHSKTKKSDEYKMLLRGGDVERYYVSWNGEEYIRYGKFLGAPREERFFAKDHIAVRQIVSGNPLRIYAGHAEAGLYNTQSIFCILSDSLNLKYLLGLLNSQLLNFYHKYKYLDVNKNVFQKILIQNCKKLPIPALDLSKKQDKAKHDNLVSLVEKMLDLKQKEATEKSDHFKTVIARQIDAVDKAIDTAVYELYSLTEDEVKVVENI
jgi:type I restriction-modification system DNA methylase subunit